MTGELLSDLREGVLSLVISNETKSNAMSQQMAEALRTEFVRAEDDDEIRVVIIRGAGHHAFCSGHDITEPVDNPSAAFDPALNEVFQRPRLLRKPTIAAVNGAAYGGGMNLALACDIRIASSTASFAAMGTRLALLPVAGQLSILPSLVGIGPAMDMLLRSRPVDAHRALAIGLATQVVDPEELDAIALKAANFLASTPPDLNEAIKRAVWSSVNEAGRSAKQVEETEAPAFGLGAEAQHRLRSFLTKTAQA
ncbi:enoyl-CoA hydratase [Arthrobacter sp. NicSoilE8]|nr:enoyl-CoA hydratase [Arthrobacter sp. NicSoilE8]